jgi:hypothetical protein
MNVEKKCHDCAYRHMPFEKLGDDFLYKNFCAKQLMYIDRLEDGTWMKYVETRIDAPPGQSRLVPVDEGNIVRANDKFHKVYRHVPIAFPCDKFLTWLALVALARQLAASP